MKRFVFVFLAIMCAGFTGANAMQDAGEGSVATEGSLTRPLKNKYIFFEDYASRTAVSQKRSAYILCEIASRREVGYCILAQDFLCESCDCPDVELVFCKSEEHCERILLKSLLERAGFIGYRHIHYSLCRARSREELALVPFLREAGIEIVES